MKNGGDQSAAGSVLPRISSPPSVSERLAGMLRRIFVRLVSPARYGRLEGSLAVAEVEITNRFDPNSKATRIPQGPNAVVPQDSWKDAALSLLGDARRALERGDIDRGWRLLHATRRMEIFGLQTSELGPYASALRAEAEKLPAWRQKAVRAIVGTVEMPISAAPADLAQAALIRDEHYNNQGYKDELTRAQFLLLAGLLAAAMLGIFALAFGGHLPSAPDAPRAGFFMLLAVTLFGALGGTVSAMLRASGGTASVRIPELTAANRVTFMRILMGGASAVVVYLALQSQIIGIFNDAFADTMSSIEAAKAYVVAFAAGFSERLVLRAVEFVAGKPPADPPKP